MNVLFKTIGKRIMLRRNELGYSQEHLAELTNLHRNYIGNVERGERHISIENLSNIARVLNIKLEELFKDF